MNRLKELRKTKRLTQEDFCELLNISQGNYSKYENDLMLPTTETLIKISEFYNVSIDYILGMDKQNQDVKNHLIMIRNYIDDLLDEIK